MLIHDETGVRFDAIRTFEGIWAKRIQALELVCSRASTLEFKYGTGSGITTRCSSAVQIAQAIRKEICLRTGTRAVDAICLCTE